MKITFALSVLLSNAAFAAPLPVCSETQHAPCTLPADEAKDVIIDMMLANPKGYEKVRFSGTEKVKIENGLMLYPTNSLTTRVTMVSENEVSSPRHEYQSVVRYELLVIDCRGTDQCGKSYIWQVEETVHSDGYTSESKFKNWLIKASVLN